MDLTGILHDGVVLSAAEKMLGHRLRRRPLLEDVPDARGRSGAFGDLQIYEIRCRYHHSQFHQPGSFDGHSVLQAAGTPRAGLKASLRA